MEVRSSTTNFALKLFTVVIEANLELQLNRIGAGSFLIGSPVDEPARGDEEQQQQVTITKPFYLGAMLVTGAKFVYPGSPPGIYRHGATLMRKFAPNDRGLFGMHGNACQWCSDWYDSHPDGAAIDPQGAKSGSTGVLRGG